MENSYIKKWKKNEEMIEWESEKEKYLNKLLGQWQIKMNLNADVRKARIENMNATNKRWHEKIKDSKVIMKYY